MKKLLFSAVLLLPAMVSAQFWDGSYQGHPAVPRQETRKLYGTYYPLEGYETASQNEYMGQTSYGNKIYTVNTAQPTYQMNGYNQNDVAMIDSYSDDNRTTSENGFMDRPYGALRLGIGPTKGFSHGARRPRGRIMSVVFGTYLNNNLRVDAEIGHHSRKKLYSKGGKSVKYSQYDFGVNGYCDLPINSQWAPFVGLGAWITNSNVTGHVPGYRAGGIDRARFALSAAAGISYRISKTLTAELMGRNRYIFGGDGIYNLEALIGLRADF